MLKNYINILNLTCKISLYFLSILFAITIRHDIILIINFLKSANYFHIFVLITSKFYFFFINIWYILFNYIYFVLLKTIMIINFFMFFFINFFMYISNTYVEPFKNIYEFNTKNYNILIFNLVSVFPKFDENFEFVFYNFYSKNTNITCFNNIATQYLNVMKNILITLLIIHLLITVFYHFNKNLFNFNNIYWISNSILLLNFFLVLIFLCQNYNFSFFSNIIIETALFSVKPFLLTFDTLSLNFVFVVITISIFVSSYQIFYLEDVFFKNRFFVQLNLFILSMILVLISGNWILLLLAWECLGQTSFFLIGFYKMKNSAYKSSIKAFVYNRLSDILLLISFSLIFIQNNNMDIVTFTELNNYTKYAGTALITASFIKSAQLIFFFWLPDSMEAPIPASALIHSATLVSAGFYILLRNIYYIENFKVNQNYLVIFSTISMLLFSLIASFQTDIKKLLAFSTISNCAFIYFLISIKLYNLAIIYFAIHGFFKSISFITSGILIKYNNHYQDFRKWQNNNIFFSIIQIILSFNTILLSVFPISIIYNIKNTIFNINTNSYTTYTLFIILILFYSFNSYNYGIKFFIFTFKNNYNFKKTKHKKININHFIFIVNIILVYYLVILIYAYQTKNIIFTTINLINLNYFLTLLIFNYIILKKKNINSKLIITLIFLLIIFNNFINI